MFVLAVASSVVMPSITVCSSLTFAMIRFSIFSRSLLYARPKQRDHHPGLFDELFSLINSILASVLPHHCPVESLYLDRARVRLCACDGIRVILQVHEIERGCTTENIYARGRSGNL